MKFEEMLNLLLRAEDFKPLIRLILDTITIYGEELEEIPNKLSKWIVKNRIESIEAYQTAGFTKEEAINLTLSDISAIGEELRSLNTKKGA